MKTLLAAAVAAALALSAAAQTAPPKGGVVQADYTMIRATVVKVDLAAREVELKDEAGKAFTISVGEKVKNLDQLRPGDVVVASLTESIAYEVKAPGKGKPGESVVSSGDAGKPGQKPEGTAKTVTTKAVTVTAIDEKKPSITFRDAKGATKTLVVKEPSRLVGVKVGDVVEVTYTESLAYSVERAPAKK